MSAMAHFRDSPVNAPSFDEWLCRRLLAGWKPEAIVAAAAGGVSLRTVYRWKRDLVGLEVVEVGGWRAVYALRDGKAPLRISGWRQ